MYIYTYILEFMYDRFNTPELPGPSQAKEGIQTLNMGFFPPQPFWLPESSSIEIGNAHVQAGSGSIDFPIYN